jgi:hypothetical protein
MRETVAPRLTSQPALFARAVAIVVAVAIVAGTAWLWVSYGPAVFFETIRAGFVACFG